MDRTAAERPGGAGTLPAGLACGQQPLGRSWGGAGGRLARVDARLLCQLGALYTTRRASHSAGGDLPGLGRGRVPRTENRERQNRRTAEPRTENREPRTENREPRTRTSCCR